MVKTPIRLEPEAASSLKITWNTGETFVVPYFEFRFACPCAACVDEHTGARTLERSRLDPLVRPVSIAPVGHYGIQVAFSDKHDTGIYAYDRLWHLCESHGRSP